MEKQDIVSLLREACRESSQRQWALRHGITPSYVSAVLAGKLDPSPSIAAALGYKRIVTYHPIRRARNGR